MEQFKATLTADQAKALDKDLADAKERRESEHKHHEDESSSK
jgi:hypothetical protein